MNNHNISDHPSFQTMMAYLEKNLSETEQGRVEAHMDDCTDCKRELDVVRRMLGAMKRQDLDAPSPNLIKRILTAFQRKQARLSQRPRRQATLQFDSWTRAAPLGVRGTPQERQLLFSESAYDLDLQVVRDSEAETFMLRGQVLDGDAQPYGLEGIELCLAGADTERYGLTDQLGRFSFSQIPKGTYSLQVILEDQDILLEPVLVEDTWGSSDIPD
jgi:hypothetical protein